MILPKKYDFDNLWDWIGVIFVALNMPSIKPIFYKLYFPGLISLVFLPIMCVGYILYSGKLNKLYRTDILWENTESVKRWSKETGIDIDVKHFRKYHNKDLTGDRKTDSLIFVDFQKNINSIIASSDTVNGYCLTFTENVKFSEVFEVLNICQPLDFRKVSYGFYNDQILVFGQNWKNRNLKSMGGNDVIIYPLNIDSQGSIDRFADAINEFKKQFIEDKRSLTSFWPSMLILLIMIYLTIARKNKYVLFSDNQ